ncbi:hypothetical protein MUP59_01655 [Candidatus Bathyarchaeota archaeon]|nr:hypothetical protein [Candidatus Bathyarchaeota archaeon]
MRRRTPYRVVQRHHLSYDPEVTVHIFRSEHGIITKLQRLLKSQPSETFLTLLSEFVQTQRQTRTPYSESEMRCLHEENQVLKQKIRKKRKRLGNRKGPSGARAQKRALKTG